MADVEMQEASQTRSFPAKLVATGALACISFVLVFLAALYTARAAMAPDLVPLTAGMLCRGASLPDTVALPEIKLLPDVAYQFQDVAAGMWLQGCVHAIAMPEGGTYYPAYSAALDRSVVMGEVTDLGVQFAGLADIYPVGYPVRLSMVNRVPQFIQIVAQ